ncbi:hypothetical protein [Magnetovibrio sp.]|uniref:hypothetical protein n=1 Tax=Magnetovibrio sp. TaxID=2024836 RepID=UPI002F9335FE
MDAATAKMMKIFEAVLRDVGGSRLELDQVVKAYQQAFPSEAMRPDMRVRLHDAIVELSRQGVISIDEETYDEAESRALPEVIEMSASANFIRTSSDQLN